VSVWKYPISWSKMKMALSCPRQLQYAVDKTPPTDIGPNYYMQLGTWVQHTFELYFNQRINLTKKGRTIDVVERVIRKVLESEKFSRADIQYPHGKTEDDLKKQIRKQVVQGWAYMDAAGILRKRIRSEVKWRAVFRGIKLFCLIDFLTEERGRTFLWDGKGHAKEDADPRQLVLYALALGASGKKIGGGGLIYWNHGIRPVDMSPRAIRNFIDEDFARVQPIFNLLRQGTNQTLEARPTPTKCNRCAWKSRCPASPYYRPQRDDYLDLGDTADFGPGTV